MFDEKIKSEFKIASKFFEHGLRNKTNSRFAHAFLLTGNDMWAQYYFAMRTAQILNCKKNQEIDCDCTNCSWIKNNSHPEVITVSQVDFVKDDSTTVISVNQARKVKDLLTNTSSYYRVIIFTGASEGNALEKQFNEEYSKYKDLMSIPKTESDKERFWTPTPLNKKIFRDDAANTLLKTIEEPNSNVVFFFLTRSKEDVIDTIVSRCQTVPVISATQKTADYDVLANLLGNFPFQSQKHALHFADRFIAELKENELSNEQGLNMFQEYIRGLIRANIENKMIVNKFYENIKTIEKAKLEIKSLVNPVASIENMLLRLYN